MTFFFFLDTLGSMWDFSPPSESVSHSVVSDSLDPMDCSPPGSSVHGDSPGKNTGVGSHSLLQGIFLTRDQTLVSCIAESLPSESTEKPLPGIKPASPALGARNLN